MPASRIGVRKAPWECVVMPPTAMEVPDVGHTKALRTHPKTYDAKVGGSSSARWRDDLARDDATESSAYSSMSLRVVVADDSLLLREGVVRLLEASGCEVVAEAGDAEALMEAVRAQRPDVAVVDIRMPPTHSDEGVRAAQEIRSEFPGTGVLVLSPRRATR